MAVDLGGEHVEVGGDALLGARVRDGRVDEDLVAEERNLIGCGAGVFLWVRAVSWRT